MGTGLCPVTTKFQVGVSLEPRPSSPPDLRPSGRGLFPTNRVKERKTSRDQSQFPLARATYTVQVFNSARAVVQSRLCSNPLSQITQTQGSRSRRVDRRARRVFALFPSDSTFISYRWQFARSFQKVFPPPHFFVKNTTTVFFFFSSTEA